MSYISHQDDLDHGYTLIALDNHRLINRRFILPLYNSVYEHVLYSLDPHIADLPHNIFHTSSSAHFRRWGSDTEGLRLPVIYVTSPYFAGVAPDLPGSMWKVKHELGEIGPERVHPEVIRRGERPIISNSHINKWASQRL